MQPGRVSGQLLRDFGSISGVLATSWWGLRKSVGDRLASLICSSRELTRASLVEEVAEGPVLTSRREVFRLLQSELGGLKRERVVALYLDTKLRLLRLAHVGDGSVRDAPLDVPKIIHMGLDVGAAALLVVHNHPSGDPAPSQSDKSALSRLRRIAADLDMHMVDALIVGGGQIRSVFD